MPNWCVTNWKIVGSHDSIQKFCDTVNDLPNREDFMKNGFGKMFLGNLAAALGCNIDVEHDNLRGTIDSDPDLVATMYFPESEWKGLHPAIGNDGVASVTFSTASAWYRPYWLQEYIANNFDEYGFYSTDEFGNFHIICNEGLFPEIYRLETGAEYYEFCRGQEDEVIKAINRDCNLDLAPCGNYEELLREIQAHEEELDEQECYFNAAEIE